MFSNVLQALWVHFFSHPDLTEKYPLCQGHPDLQALFDFATLSEGLNACKLKISTALHFLVWALVKLVNFVCVGHRVIANVDLRHSNPLVMVPWCEQCQRTLADIDR